MTKRTKLIVSAVLGLVVSLVACATQDKQLKIPMPSKKMAGKSGESLDKLGRGYSVFQTSCAQCHELRLPADMKVKEWHQIVPGMAWNAGLSKQDEKALLAYLVAATEQQK